MTGPDKNGYYQLASGRRLRPSAGCFTLVTATDDRDYLAFGYDNFAVGDPSPAELEDEPETPVMGPADRAELAEFMVARWRTWGGLREPVPAGWPEGL